MVQVRRDYESYRFNTQPPEGGCVFNDFIRFNDIVSTHSRPKAAASAMEYTTSFDAVSTHSRPKAAGRLQGTGRL